MLWSQGYNNSIGWSFVPFDSPGRLKRNRRWQTCWVAWVFIVFYGCLMIAIIVAVCIVFFDLRNILLYGSDNVQGIRKETHVADNDFVARVCPYAKCSF